MEFEKVTASALEVAELLAWSQAVAVRLCDPFAKLAVFKVKVYGLAVSAVPYGRPSNWS